MKIVFLSNYFNHHQKPLSDALAQMSDEFLFVAASEMREERRQLGYHSPEASYVVHLNAEHGISDIMKAVDEADAVILGSAPEDLIRQRLKKRRLTFRYSERPLKRENSFWRYLPRLIKWRRNNPQNTNLYLLCAGAFVAADYAAFGLFKHKAFQWGYFPETKRYSDISELIRKKRRGSLLWVGRFLSWKHPELAVEAVKALKDCGCDVTLDIIGTGEEETAVKNKIREYRLEDCIHLLGAMPYEEVRGYMERSEIFLCTSDKQEGWGAVINEAMNSGCAVVASHNIGAVPYLITDGFNGLVFECCNQAMLHEKLVYLLEHQRERIQMSCEAYRTVTELWNAETAAERLILLIEGFRHSEAVDEMFQNGPCSSAGLLSDSWKDRYY